MNSKDIAEALHTIEHIMVKHDPSIAAKCKAWAEAYAWLCDNGDDRLAAMQALVRAREELEECLS